LDEPYRAVAAYAEPQMVALITKTLNTAEFMDDTFKLGPIIDAAVIEAHPQTGAHPGRPLWASG